MNILLVSFGAVLGAIARWQFGVWLNPLLSHVEFGTLLANWAGCLLIGIAMGMNLHDSHKLLIITGFLGSFTTFSSFSAEVAEKLMSEKYASTLGVLGLHLIGGILLTIVGILLARMLTSG